MGGKNSSEYQSIIREMKALVRPEKAAFLPKFFKVYPGGYGEGDVFLGVVVPDTRKVARHWRRARMRTIATLLDDAHHELRLCGLLILVDQFKQSNDTGRQALVDLYLAKIDRVNSWDLVDISAPNTIGLWLMNRDRALLDELLDSGQLWRQRIAMLATLAFIRENDFADTLRIADVLLHHEHDLIHKAVGWMLREVGNRNCETLEDFLATRYNAMPRTMLRYAIEKLPESRRQDYLRGRVG